MASYRRNQWLLLLLLAFGLFATGKSKLVWRQRHNPSTVESTSNIVQSRYTPCNNPRSRGVHLPRVSLPAWYQSHSNHNWPPMTEVDADPRMDTFTGQGLEDKFAFENFFYNRGRGTYLETGAFDGKELSNTRWFNRALGWRGVMIEPSADTYAALIVNRPTDININAAVCADHKLVHFLSKHAVGGIWEFMSDNFKQQWHPTVAVESLPTIPCLPLTAILQKFGVTHIDFFSLDVEGGELELLRAINFDCISISVIVVEADNHSPTKDQGVRDLLVSKGYIYYNGTTIERNDWFVHKDFVPSVKPQ